jgi:hypothetical protein
MWAALRRRSAQHRRQDAEREGYIPASGSMPRRSASYGLSAQRRGAFTGVFLPWHRPRRYPTRKRKGHGGDSGDLPPS